MTRKEARRRLTAAIREQRAAQEEVSEANARVVEATSKLPPHYVDKRFAGGERERIQKLVDQAQRASDRLGAAIADVVNLRGLVSIQQVKKSPLALRAAQPPVTAPTKKSHARIKREVDEVLEVNCAWCHRPAVRP